VFGGGGLIGLAFHAGALKALAERDVDVSGADVIVGTSAGSIVASYLASGRDQESFFESAHRGEPHDEIGRLFAPAWSSPGDRVRRLIGSGFAMMSSRGLWRAPRPASFLRRAFPSGLYSMSETRMRLGRELPDDWPERELFICAADLYTGRRVAFGGREAPHAGLVDAVMASIAIPGVFPAVRIGGHHYVDGGVVSATSLDLAATSGCDAILCIAPLGYRNDFPPTFRQPRSWSPVIVRTPFTRTLRREVISARAAGAHVLVLRPYLSDIHAWGTNFMRIHDRAEVAEAARRSAHRMLDDQGDHPVLEALATQSSGRLSLVYTPKRPRN
jgi:NTE family protein